MDPFFAQEYLRVLLRNSRVTLASMTSSMRCLFAALTCVQVRHELLKVGIIAQQLATGCDQPVHLFVT